MQYWPSRIKLSLVPCRICRDNLVQGRKTKQFNQVLHALALPPPPDAPAFDAVAYGMAPPLSPGRGVVAAAGGLVGRDGRRVLVAGGAAVAGGAPPEPGVAPPEPRRVQSAREAVATKRAAGRQRHDRPGADAQGLTLPELEAPAVVVAVVGAAAGGGAIGVVRPATTREARSAGLEVGGGGRAGGRGGRGAGPGACSRRASTTSRAVAGLGDLIYGTFSHLSQCIHSGFKLRKSAHWSLALPPGGGGGGEGRWSRRHVAALSSGRRPPRAARAPPAAGSGGGGAGGAPARHRAAADAAAGANGGRARREHHHAHGAASAAAAGGGAK